MFWANYVAPFLATAFIILGLVLLVDAAHTWSETCLYNWERFDSDLWKLLLLGTTFGLYGGVVVTTILLFVYFSPSGCALNTTLITLNVVVIVALTALSVHPRIQEANPRSGLAQSSMVLAYCTYLLASALINRDDKHCNPIAGKRGDSSKTTSVVVGAMFTFIAIAYSTTRAATQSTLISTDASAQVDAPAGYGPLATDDTPQVITQQPQGQDSLRIEAIRAAVDAGSIPASALDAELRKADDDDDDDDDDAPAARDDERNETRYNYSAFHLTFALAACYTAMLLTDWQRVKLTGAPRGPDEGSPPVVFIGVSSRAMWMRIVSSWVCAAIYAWTLIAPILLPDRFAY